uniref:T-cell receptor alpha/delta variable 31.0 n=1 Tax=Salmo trutta TaxID=8032 RepID=A0A674BEU6_SALTR
MIFWYSILLLLPILFVRILAVDQQSGHVTALEGGLVTLSCTYTTSSTSPDLFWYIPLTRDSPQYVLRRDRYSEGSNSDEFKKRFDSRRNFTSSSFPLTIQRLQLSDSAVYYCALRPTVTTGDSVTVQQHRVECCSDNVTNFSMFDDTQKEEETRISKSRHGLVDSDWYYSSPTDLTVTDMEPWLRNVLILAACCYAAIQLCFIGTITFTPAPPLPRSTSPVY